jgi:hypothetical protein
MSIEPALKFHVLCMRRQASHYFGVDINPANILGNDIYRAKTIAFGVGSTGTGDANKCTTMGKWMGE